MFILTLSMFNFSSRGRGYTTRDGELSTHNDVRRSYKNIGISFFDVVYCIGIHVGRNASEEEFPTHDQYGVGNTSPDVSYVDACHDVRNSFS